MSNVIEETVSEQNSTSSGTVDSVTSSFGCLCPIGSQFKAPASLSSEELHDTVLTKSPYDSPEQRALANVCINTIRFLCVDAINNAKSGHPGICMGMGAAAFVLFDNHLKFNPSNPKWVNRDRFVLSAGHGSMLLYSLLCLYGYDSVTLEDIKSFRKLNSRTPGHPECAITPGVEVSTGPLGQGICNAVGIAISEAHLASVYNRPGHEPINNYTYCIAGDGCLMEGMSAEACSLAGHLKLGKLIVLYDDNHISIDGGTDLAFTEDVALRFQAYEWQVLHVQDGNDNVIAIDQAIALAKRTIDRPTLIKVTTTIGYGAPTVANTAKAHGAALGAEETRAARKALNYEYDPFVLPPPSVEHFRRKKISGVDHEKAWDKMLAEYRTTFPGLHASFSAQVLLGRVDSTVEDAIRNEAFLNRSQSQATRKHSKSILNAFAPHLPSLMGGAADTTPSTLTNMECSGDYSVSNRTGRNIRFGVREHAMGAISNGISLSGYNMRSFCSTFFVFSDYMRAAMRMAALSETGTIFIMTHDSVGLGEDGPSHQPVEHLASFRAMPNHDLWRPADSIETGAAYSVAVATKKRPSTLVLSRQTVGAVPTTNYDGAKRGGYVVNRPPEEGSVDGIIVATGSEVSLCVEAAKQMFTEKKVRAHVVSLPCWSQFERQDKEYRRGVFCVERERILSVEAGSSFGWSKYANHHVAVDEFGRSGPGKDVLDAFGISTEHVKARFLEIIGLDS